jgi:hypothetical protein
MRGVLRTAVFVFACLICASSVFAQATLSGVIKDASGGVLPGVTVEATSPALIERARTAITDGNGQYQIVDLRPGAYTLTFTLSGFSVTRRENIEVTGSGVIAINVEMRVGTVSETITVTGETPIVDVQSTRRQAVLDGDVLNSLPMPRGYGNLLAAVTGMQVTIGPPTSPGALWYTAHGGRGNEGKVQIGGLNAGGAIGGGGTTGFAYDTSNSTEVQFTISGGLGEVDIGGPIMNIIPREGGNTVKGSLFGSTAGKWSQGHNLDDQLRAFGITEQAGLIKNYDTSASVGGPIKKDLLWFYSSARQYESQSDVPGLYGNRNVGDAAKWNYVRDDGVKVRNADGKTIGSVRLTSALTPRNKVGFYIDYQRVCTGSNLVVDAGGCRNRGSDWVALGALGFGNSSPESASRWDDREKVVQATWSSPVSSKLLLEAGYSTFISLFGGQEPNGGITNLIPVTEQTASAITGVPAGNFAYRAIDTRSELTQSSNFWRASASYVTGSHNIKVGTQGAYNVSGSNTFANQNQLAYRFNNGVPNQFTMRLAPVDQNNRSVMHGLYAQDQWTVSRLTVQGALRYEHAYSWHPEEQNGVPIATRFNRAPISFGRVEGVKGYDDIVPRMGVAWDVFGKGKTAVKVNFGKYLEAVTNAGNYTINNKAAQLQTSTTRNWTDGNRDLIPNCDLLNPAQQTNAATGESCGPWSNLNFADVLNLTQVNPAVLEGWGIRPWDWQFGASIQQEILPRLSLELGYNRRWFGNFFVTDNLAIGPRDYDRVNFAAPVDSRLPDGGGFAVPFLTRNSLSAFGATQNYYTFESDYGNARRYWHGVDVDIRARMSNGLVFQGGTSTGRGVRDTCEITAALPETLTIFGTIQRVDSCLAEEKWLTTFRGLATYMIPKVEVFFSAIIRLQPNASVPAAGTTVATNGVALSANQNIPNATIQQILGRPLAGGAQNTTVNLLLPGSFYPEDNLNNVDLRFGKVLKFGRTKTDIAIDLYNLFNANTATAFDQVYGVNYLRPTGVRGPRFLRFNVTFDF